MRKWFVIVMLFLLPLRGVVGDAMAYSMLPDVSKGVSTAQRDATNSVAARALFDWARASFYPQNHASAMSGQPCHMVATAAEPTDDNDQASNQCTACQTCHMSAATPLQLHSPVLQSAAELPAQRAAQWHSADARLLAKTPIF
jgi:hypothetical protein